MGTGNFKNTPENLKKQFKMLENTQKIFKNDRFTIAFPHEHIFINIHTKKSQKNQKKSQKIRKICEPSHAMSAPLETLFTQFRKAPGSTQLT